MLFDSHEEKQKKSTNQETLDLFRADNSNDMLSKTPSPAHNQKYVSNLKEVQMTNQVECLFYMSSQLKFIHLNKL